MVLRAIPMVETMTNIMEMKDTMLAVVEDSGCSIRSQMHFWYLQEYGDGDQIAWIISPSAAVVGECLGGVLLHLHALSLHLLVDPSQLSLIPI